MARFTFFDGTKAEEESVHSMWFDEYKRLRPYLFCLMQMHGVLDDVDEFRKPLVFTGACNTIAERMFIPACGVFRAQ